MKQIYKISYPNGKIYIGKDLTGTLNYFGSANSKLIEQDFSDEEKKKFSIIKEILWETNEDGDSEINKREVEYIISYDANNSNIGYNNWPKYREKKHPTTAST